MGGILRFLGALACMSAVLFGAFHVLRPFDHYDCSGYQSSSEYIPSPCLSFVLGLALFVLAVYLSSSFIMTATMTTSSTATTVFRKPRRTKSQKKASGNTYEGDTEINNDPPTASDLVKCADLPVLDQNKTPRPFKSLYSGTKSTERTLVIFIRHFFCGVSHM